VGSGGSWRTARSRRAVGPWGQAREARTLLGMFVRYYVELPLAAARVLLHRVAEATLKDFLDRLGAAITLSRPGGTARMRT